MGTKEILEKIPVKGFIKLSREKVEFKSPGERAALIRKGNELFNAKKYELAKRIYITTGYSDGLIRLADYYLEQKNPMEAFRLYWLAPSKKKVETMTEKMALIIKFWLQAKEKGMDTK